MLETVLTSLNQQAKQKAASAKAALAGGKAVTAALFVTAGFHAMTGPLLLTALMHRKRLKEEKVSEKKQKIIDAYNELQCDVTALRTANIPLSKMTVANLRILGRWYKRDNDESLPTSRAELIMRLNQIEHRGDLPPPSAELEMAAALLPPPPPPPPPADLPPPPPDASPLAAI